MRGLSILEGLPLYLITIFLLKVFSLLSKNDSTFLIKNVIGDMNFTILFNLTIKIHSKKRLFNIFYTFFIRFSEIKN